MSWEGWATGLFLLGNILRAAVVAIVILVSFLLALLLPMHLYFQNPYLEVCAIINENYFAKDRKFDEFIMECQRRAQQVRWYHSRKQIVGDLKYFLPSLQVSHLSVYEPPETKRYWSGEAKNTGAFARFTDGHLMIFKVLTNSPAQKAGLQVGDEILFIDGELPGEAEVENQSGIFKIARGNDIFEFKIETAVLQIDQQPQLVEINSRTAILEVSSFRKPFFTSEQMESLQKRINRYPNLILDMRQNIGGNVVAGMRLLNLFYCQPKVFGEMRRRFEQTKEAPVMPDDLEELMQIDFLMKTKGAILKAQSNNNCYRGKMVALIDAGSASTTEFVAKALQDTRRATLIGNLSAGKTLLGLWFPLPLLGREYSLSVPILEIQVNGVIEGLGVRPDKVVAYDYAQARKGQDSWVETALYHIETTRQFTPPD